MGVFLKYSMWMFPMEAVTASHLDNWVDHPFTIGVA